MTTDVKSRKESEYRREYYKRNRAKLLEYNNRRYLANRSRIVESLRNKPVPICAVAVDEEWKAIVNYEGLYEVSNYGRVKSVARDVATTRPRTHRVMEKELKLINFQKKYKAVNLYKDRKQKRFSVHRLVAGAFIDNPDGLPFVNHIDMNPSNNHVSNLEWCTPEHNNLHAIQVLKSERNEMRDLARKLVKENVLSISEIAKVTGYSDSNIHYYVKKFRS